MLKETIINAARISDANEFAAFLDQNRIEWEMLDVNIVDFNFEYFNIFLPEFDENILFSDGVYQEN